MSDIQELQRLLLGQQGKDALDDLGECVRDPEQRARFLAEVLPQALRAAQGQGERLTGALQEPVTHCIHESVQRDAGRFADALYPAMGPAIRKSITETLKEFVQNLNQVLEHSFSYRGLKWRWEAMRSGVPFAEVVLKNTLLYRVEETYLIHRESGLLMDYVSARRDLQEQDEDAVSAMLTAIQDFVRDAFAGGGSNDLETLELGERIVWVIRGPRAMMACVIRGLPPLRLRERLGALLDEIHQRYAEAMAGFQGDRQQLAGIGDLLRQSLAAEEREAEGGRGFPWPAVFLLLGLAAGAAAAWAYFTDDTALRERRSALLQLLDREPGMLVLDAATRDGRFSIRGLRDPMARPPLQVAAEAGWDAAELSLDFHSYQSLDPGLLLARVRGMLDPPPGVRLALLGEQLRVGGLAPPDWVDRLRRHFVPPAGIEAVDSSALYDDESAMLQQLQDLLQPPEGLRLTVEGRNLRLSGEAPLDWLQGLDPLLAGVHWLGDCRAGGVSITDWTRAQDLQQELARFEVFFSDGLILTDASEQALSARIERLGRLQALADGLGVALQVSLTGHSDGVGNRERNFWLRHERVALIAQRLERNGLQDARLRSDIETRFEPALQPELKRRKVVLQVALQGTPQLPPGRCR